MKKTNALILSVAILVVAAILFFWLNSTEKKQREIDRKSGQITELQNQKSEINAKLIQIDSLYVLSSDSLIVLKDQNKKLVASYEAIRKLSKEKKDKVYQLNDSSTLVAFKSFTGINFDQNVISILPDTSFEIPVSSLRSAVEKFVYLDEELAINDNLVDQNDNFAKQIVSFETMIRNRDQAIQLLELNNTNLEKQNNLNASNAASYEAMLRKEKRKKNLFKSTTIIGAALVIISLIR